MAEWYDAIDPEPFQEDLRFVTALVFQSECSYGLQQKRLCLSIAFSNGYFEHRFIQWLLGDCGSGAASTGVGIAERSNRMAEATISYVA